MVIKSFNVGEDTKLKIKPKAPKSGKGGSKKEGPKADFCTLKTMDKEIGQNFVFEKPDFKNAEINHTFYVEQIVVPDELKTSEDFAKIREESIRKGRIVRKAIIDEEDKTQEFEFAA